MVKPTKCAEPSKTDEIFVANMTQFSCATLDELQNAFDRVMLRSDLMNSKHMIMILQKSIPFDASSEKPLPGISPLDPDQWLMIDDSYGAQMLLRQELITTKRDQVIAIDPAALPAARELLWQVVDYFTRTCAMRHVDGVIQTPDGRRVPVDYDDPMGCMGQIAQNDFAIMEQRGEEHVLTAAVLCFPASWLLAEKFMRGLVGIHDPVDPYDDQIAKRVQRLFDGIQVDRPLWRFNALRYADPALFQPRSMYARRPGEKRHIARYLRSERQTLIRLPKTGAVVFGIHTFVVDTEA